MKVKKVGKYLLVLFISASFFLFALSEKKKISKNQLTEEQQEKLKEKLKETLGNISDSNIRIETKGLESKNTKKKSKRNNISTKKISQKTPFLKIDTKNEKVLNLVDKYNLMIMKAGLKVLNKLDKAENLFIKENQLRMEKEILQKKVENSFLNNNVLEAEITKEKNSLKEKEFMMKNFKKNKYLQKDIVTNKVKYTYDPFDAENGILKVSDRVILMPSVIWSGTGKDIMRKINFYANQNDYPIFLIIDMCMGGMLFEGQLIMKAVEQSKVPVYVVLKTFAASMAAIIITRAKHSFVYPNAMILHHQAMVGMGGNPTQIEGQLRFLKEINQQIFKPIIKKMNLKSINNMEDFAKMMYRKNIDGDWIEFGDNAVKKYNWANKVVNYIEEFNDNVEEEKSNGLKFILSHKNTGKQNKEILYIPNGASYYLYNPNNKFEIRVK